MSSININLVNNSGRSIDHVLLYHSPNAPIPGPPLSFYPNAIDARNLANGATVSVKNFSTTSFDPADYWIGGVLYEGDGTGYVISGVLWDPYKEYAVSDGNTLTITIPAYEPNSTNQGDMVFDDGTGDPGNAPLLNGTVSDWVQWLKLVGDIVQELVGDDG